MAGMLSHSTDRQSSYCSLSAIARALSGEVIGRQVLCPGPGHSKRDRSLSVKLSICGSDGFIVHSFAGDDPLKCKDYVRSLIGSNEPRPSAEPPNHQRLFSINEQARVAKAIAVWNSALDPRETIVEQYLSSRGLRIPDEVAGEVIRFNPACPWTDKLIGQIIRVPAMIALMRSVGREDIKAVHITRLTPDGRKIERRMLGIAAGAAIMLCPYSAIGAGVAIGEGIESCLSAWQIGWTNCWSLGSAGAVANFPVLEGVQSLIVLCETDDANRRAADAVAKRYEDAGREVLFVSPRRGGDLNDALMIEGSACA